MHTSALSIEVVSDTGKQSTVVHQPLSSAQLPVAAVVVKQHHHHGISGDHNADKKNITPDSNIPPPKSSFCSVCICGLIMALLSVAAAVFCLLALFLEPSTSSSTKSSLLWSSSSTYVSSTSLATSTGAVVVRLNASATTVATTNDVDIFHWTSTVQRTQLLRAEMNWRVVCIRNVTSLKTSIVFWSPSSSSTSSAQATWNVSRELEQGRFSRLDNAINGIASPVLLVPKTSSSSSTVEETNTVDCFPIPTSDGATTSIAMMEGSSCVPPIASGGLQRDQIIMVVLVAATVGCLLMFPFPVGLFSSIFSSTLSNSTGDHPTSQQQRGCLCRLLFGFLCRPPTLRTRVVTYFADVCGCIMLIAGVVLFSTGAQSRWFCSGSVSDSNNNNGDLCTFVASVGAASSLHAATAMQNIAERSVHAAALNLLLTSSIANVSSDIQNDTSAFVSIGSFTMSSDASPYNSNQVGNYCSTNIGGNVWLLVVAIILLSLRVVIRLLFASLLEATQQQIQNPGPPTTCHPRGRRTLTTRERRHWYSPDGGDDEGEDDLRPGGARSGYMSNTSAEPTWPDVTSTRHDDTDAVISNSAMERGGVLDEREYAYPPYYRQKLIEQQRMLANNANMAALQQQQSAPNTITSTALNADFSSGNGAQAFVLDVDGRSDSSLRSPITRANLAQLQETLIGSNPSPTMRPSSIIEVDTAGDFQAVQRQAAQQRKQHLVTNSVVAVRTAVPVLSPPEELEEADLSGHDVQDWFREPQDIIVSPAAIPPTATSTNRPATASLKQQRAMLSRVQSNVTSSSHKKAAIKKLLLNRHHRMTAPTEYPSRSGAQQVQQFFYGNGALTPSVAMIQQQQQQRQRPKQQRGASSRLPASMMQNPLEVDLTIAPDDTLSSVSSLVTVSSQIHSAQGGGRGDGPPRETEYQSPPPAVPGASTESALEEVDTLDTSDESSEDNSTNAAQEDDAFDMNPLEFQMSEWAADQDTGMFWSKKLMLFFDPASRRYFDPRSSEWYSSIADVPSSTNQVRSTAV